MLRSSGSKDESRETTGRCLGVKGQANSKKADGGARHRGTGQECENQVVLVAYANLKAFVMFWHSLEISCILTV